MTEVSIAVPDQVQDFIDQRLAEGAFADASEYLMSLIHDDQIRQTSRKVDTLLIEGLESGLATVVDHDYVVRKRAELADRISKLNTNAA